MTTATATPGKKTRGVRLTKDGWLVIREEKNGAVKVDAYRVECRGGFWRFSKADGKVYNVRLGDKPESCSCTCPGHTYHRHCRHWESLLALRAAGRLS